MLIIEGENIVRESIRDLCECVCLFKSAGGSPPMKIICQKN